MAVASPVALHRLWGAWVSEVAALRLSSVGSVVVLQGHVGCSRTSEWTPVPCIVYGFLPTAPPSKSYFVAFFLHEVFIMYIIYKSYYYSSFSCETTSSEDVDLKGWILLLVSAHSCAIMMDSSSSALSVVIVNKNLDWLLTLWVLETCTNCTFI